MLLQRFFPILCFLIPAASGALSHDAAALYFTRAENVTSVRIADGLSSASLASDRRTGVNRLIAEHAAAGLGGADIFSIRVKSPYPASFDETVRQSHDEQSSGALPELVPLPDLKRYSTLALVFPVWSMTLPQPAVRFLLDAADDLKGKRIIVFCSHDGYGAGRVPSEVRRLLPASRVEAEAFAAEGRLLDKESLKRAESLARKFAPVSISGRKS